MTASTRSTLRFGVMCSGTVFDAWQARCLEALHALGTVEPGLLIIDDRARPSRRVTQRISRLVRSEKMVWKAFNDGFAARGAAGLRKVDLCEEFASVPKLECRVTMRGKFSEIFDDADVATIRGHDLDFILRFAFGIVRGDILDSAAFGIWSFHHDDEALYRGGPPCFWEIYNGDPVTGVMLQRLTERLDAGVVLHKGHVRTVASSYAKNSDAAHFAGAAFPAKICNDILAGVREHVDAAPAASNAPIHHNPTNRQMLRFLARLGRNYVAGQARSSLFRDHWNVGVVSGSIERFLDPAFIPDVRWLAPPAARHVYVADPFGIDGRDGILFEAFDHRTQQGVIRAVGGPSGTPTAGESVLPEAVHTSYPFLVEHDSQIYCLPEAAGTRSVRIFRASNFPDGWDDLGTLVDDVAAVDPTVFEHDGRWWLFFTDKDVDSNAVLHVWHAPDLLGPWSAHVSNPVKTDVRSARPAGTPFVHGGRLYRPAQDCSTTYGGGIALNEVMELTETRFRERVVHVVRPAAAWRYPAGCHTLSAIGAQTLIDGKRRVFAGRTAVGAIASKARRGIARVR